jgi:hypothetical protein
MESMEAGPLVNLHPVDTTLSEAFDQRILNPKNAESFKSPIKVHRSLNLFYFFRGRYGEKDAYAFISSPSPCN